jgi:hypothetical protein
MCTGFRDAVYNCAIKICVSKIRTINMCIGHVSQHKFSSGQIRIC